MKARTIILCAAVLLTACTVLFAQKTEVSVKKGKVVAETQTTSVTVEAGRKTVLLPGKAPIVTVDEPLVNDVMEMYKWAEVEKQEQRVKINNSFIEVSSLEQEQRFTFAYFAEAPNPKSEPSSTCQIPGGALFDEPRFYDLQGNLLRFDVEKKDYKYMNVSGVTATYTVHFQKPVGPGENFKGICVGKRSNISVSEFWKEGVLRHYVFGGGGPNCVNYFRIILPKSAIFVEADSPVTMLDSVDGRVALTIRSYGGPDGRGSRHHIAFLWPDKDGTSLADLPPQYRGLRDRREEDLVQEYRRVVAEISEGKKYNDQSTPVTTLLSLHSAGVHKDKDMALTLTDPERREKMGSVVSWFSKMLLLAELYRTPPWPAAPTEGQMHRVDLCQKGVLLPEASLGFVYRGSKWYILSVWIGHVTDEIVMK